MENVDELKTSNIEKEQLFEELTTLNHLRISLTKTNAEMESKMEKIKRKIEKMKNRSPPTNMVKL